MQTQNQNTTDTYPNTDPLCKEINAQLAALVAMLRDPQQNPIGARRWQAKKDSKAFRDAVRYVTGY